MAAALGAPGERLVTGNERMRVERASARSSVSHRAWSTWWTWELELGPRPRVDDTGVQDPEEATGERGRVRHAGPDGQREELRLTSGAQWAA